jgi:hypothetical protein
MPVLTSEQEIAIIHAAKPLQADERTPFMAALTAWLNDRAEVGDGELSRQLGSFSSRPRSSAPTAALMPIRVAGGDSCGFELKIARAGGTRSTIRPIG